MTKQSRRNLLFGGAALAGLQSCGPQPATSLNVIFHGMFVFGFTKMTPPQIAARVPIITGHVYGVRWGNRSITLPHDAKLTLAGVDGLATTDTAALDDLLKHKVVLAKGSKPAACYCEILLPVPKLNYCSNLRLATNKDKIFDDNVNLVANPTDYASVIAFHYDLNGDPELKLESGSFLKSGDRNLHIYAEPAFSGSMGHIEELCKQMSVDPPLCFNKGQAPLACGPFLDTNFKIGFEDTKSLYELGDLADHSLNNKGGETSNCLSVFLPDETF